MQAADELLTRLLDVLAVPERLHGDGLDGGKMFLTR
jgi:hypothetical protein